MISTSSGWRFVVSARTVLVGEEHVRASIQRCQWHIYEVSSKGFSWYEVFHRRKVNGIEVYPKSKQFGITAWQVVSLERALLKIARFHESDTPSADDGLSMPEEKSCDLPKTLNKNRRSYDSTQQPNKTL